MNDKALTYTSSAGTKEGTVILKLVGPLTLGNMFTLQNDLRAMKPACLIVDMTDVNYMDSAGLGVLMNAFVAADDGNRKFLLAGVNQRIMSLLEMTKVDQVLKLFPSVEAAEAS